MKIIDAILEYLWSLFKERPITPPLIEDKPDLWIESDTGSGWYAHKHNRRVVKDEYGTIYYMHKYLFLTASNRCGVPWYDSEWRSQLSPGRLTLPCTPRPHYIKPLSLEYVIFRIYKFFNVEYK